MCFLQKRPPCAVVDLFNDFRDGSKLLDLLEVMSGHRIVSPSSHPQLRLLSNLRAFDIIFKLFIIHYFPESGEGKRNVSAQEQHRESSVLPEE